MESQTMKSFSASYFEQDQLRLAVKIFIRNIRSCVRLVFPKVTSNQSYNHNVFVLLEFKSVGLEAISIDNQVFVLIDSKIDLHRRMV